MRADPEGPLRSLARRYFNLEAPEERTKLDARWEEVVAGDGPVVFDEAQNWPELFRRLRGATLLSR